MGVLSKIFGSKKTTNAIVSTIDNAWFTDQEKSKYLLEYLAATQPQNMARRLIAFIVVALWALLVLIAVMVYKLDAGFSGFVFSTLHENVNTPFSIIIGFYFAAHLARAWKDNESSR